MSKPWKITGPLLFSVICCLLSDLQTRADALTIDTRGPDGLSPLVVGNFGEPNAATVGQVFMVVGDNRQLNSFTFFLFHPAGPANHFAGYVAAWDGMKAVGPLLYESELRSTGENEAILSVSFDGLRLKLGTGQDYVAFLSASKFFDGVEDTTNLFQERNTYTDGYFVALPNGNDFSAVFTSDWGGLRPNDVDFVAEFSKPVPEPTTILLLGTGLAGIGGMIKRRR